MILRKFVSIQPSAVSRGEWPFARTAMRREERGERREKIEKRTILYFLFPVLCSLNPYENLAMMALSNCQEENPINATRTINRVILKSDRNLANKS
jgi:hypothetical protein